MSSISSELFTKSQVLASECIQYLTKCVSPYHCVSETIRFLDGCGFRRLSEKENWNSELLRNGRYYVTRNESTLAAFLIGGNFDAQNGVKIVGAHTDSPNLHLKPVTSNTRSGYEGVQVQLYGGGLWHTWFDRDLGIAGKLIYRKKSGPDAQSVLHTKLVCVAQPILRIPTLAIHLTETEERTSFAPHKENHIAPILATSVINAVCGPEASVTPSNDESLQNKEGKIQTSSRCSAALTRLLFGSIDEDPECTELVDFDLNLFDAVAPVLGGLHKEFIFSGRIDNLLSCYAATRALLESIHTNDDGQGLATDTRARMIALFDHEEVGSCSAEGADSSFIPDILQRIVSCPLFATKGSGDVQSVRPVFHANSFFISADGAHALHPNYSERHQAQHAPNLQHGVVIKKNANVRYATNAFTSAMVREIARRRKIPVQEFCVKNNSPCGSTIGPMIAAATGIPTVDIGAPMLSMHSIREMCGVVDLWYLKEVLHEYFVSFEKITITGPSV